MLYGLDQHDCLQMPTLRYQHWVFSTQSGINECGWLYIIFYPAGLSFNGSSLLCVICCKYMHVHSFVIITLQYLLYMTGCSCMRKNACLSGIEQFIVFRCPQLISIYCGIARHVVFRSPFSYII